MGQIQRLLDGARKHHVRKRQQKVAKMFRFLDCIFAERVEQIKK